MNILILGGGGMLGQKLARALLERGHLRGAPITRLTLADIAPPAALTGAEAITCNIADPASVTAAIAADTDVIFHLAAIVSSQAEQDFDLGLQINLDGTRHVLDAARALGTCPVVVFTSSLAVYGGDVPDPITDYSFLNPQTSYGVQKAMGELLVNDYSRRGFVDGRGFRLPTISVRPGAPNRAASGFMSSIFREPLNGVEATCPVDLTFAHYYLSPRRCVENLILGAELAAGSLGQNRCMIMPGRMWTIAQMIAAMKEVVGPEPARLIRFEAQSDIAKIVNGWRADLRADRALALGLRADDSFADNIRAYLVDDMPTNVEGARQ
ncbi:MAG: D-erythronate dehydrogenase [Paracoccaceae bacterium]